MGTHQRRAQRTIAVGDDHASTIFDCTVDMCVEP